MIVRNKAFAALALTSLLGVAACGDTKDEHGERGRGDAGRHHRRAPLPAGRSRRA